VGRFMEAAGALALWLRLAEGRRRSTAERHPMADGDLMVGSLLMEADRRAEAEGTSRWVDHMAVVADRMAAAADRMAVAAGRMPAVADRMAAVVIVAEIASRARLINRGGL